MNVKKMIAASAAVAVLTGSALNVSAAEMDLIIDVDAYREAYSDLEEAFGDDTDAYIEHYLTTGVYEGRTKGVLFDPLAYAEAYSDIKGAFGDDIRAIVNHYVTLGITENRTMGTANGYADIDAAMKGGAVKAVPRNVNSSAVDYSSVDSGENSTAGNDYAGETAEGSLSVNSAGSSNSSAGAGSSSNTGNSNTGNSNTGNNKTYDHTTSIYENDYSALLRVEYYDENNKLVEYSSVSNYDKDTNSYTEDVYSYNNEENVQVHERTDTYVNGVLVSSEKH